MKIYFILSIALLASITNCSVPVPEPNPQPDYFQYEACPDFDNSQYVKNLQITFNRIPTSGQPCMLNITGVAVQDVYISYVHAIAKFNLIKIIDQNREINIEYKAGD